MTKNSIQGIAPILLFLSGSNKRLSEMPVLSTMIATDFAPPPVGVAHLVTPADVEWFKANPNRRHRVRVIDEEEESPVFVVVREDQGALRALPAAADFQVPDKEDMAEVMYVMSAYMIQELLRSGTENWIDMDEFAAAVTMRRAARRMA